MRPVDSPLRGDCLPMLLAYTMAHAIAQHLMHQGWQPLPAQLTPPERVSFQYLHAIVGS